MIYGEEALEGVQGLLAVNVCIPHFVFHIHSKHMQRFCSVANCCIQFQRHLFPPTRGTIATIWEHPLCDYVIIAIVEFRVPNKIKQLDEKLMIYHDKI